MQDPPPYKTQRDLNRQSLRVHVTCPPQLAELSVAHLEENLAAASLELSDEEVAALDQAA